MEFTQVDWIIALILIFSTLLSFFRGFLREALALGSWVVAIIVARWLAEPVAAQLSPFIEVASIRMVVAYAGLIIGTLIVCGLVTRLLGQLVKLSGLSATDRLLGMAFGLIRGGLIVVIGVAALQYWSPFAQDRWWQASVFVPYVLQIVDALAPLVLEQTQQLINT